MEKPHNLQLNKKDFDLTTPDDFVAVDHRCKGILLHFYKHLIAGGTLPTEATLLANGADFFIRDFVVDQMALNIFDEHPGIVRKFAGNWYIITTVEPDIRQLEEQLRGIKLLYRYLHGQKLVSSGYLAAIEQECDDVSFYRRRIETFWGIAGDGYMAWDKECPLKGI